MAKRGNTTPLHSRKAGAKSERPYNVAAPWVVKAFGLWANGMKNWCQIAREVGHDRETVKRNVVRYADTLAVLLDGGEVNPLAEYLQGLYHDLAEQLKLAETAVKPIATRSGLVDVVDYRARSQARKEATAIRESIAAAQGVVTERKSMALTGPDGGAIQVETRLEHLTDAELAAALAEVAAVDDGSADGNEG